MRLLHRLMILFSRTPAPSRPPDPDLAPARRRLAALEASMAAKLHIPVEQLRADYERADGAIGARR